MTLRRYYADSYTSRFTARVVETPPGPAAAVLDETFFYPTSGGQPHDIGTLGRSRVLDVQFRESDGAIVHLLDAPLPPGPVAGELDWARRFDHMQQHTGQHILSQAFLRTAEAPTIGFHLTAESLSIDLSVPGLTDSSAADAEVLANQIIRSNAAVKAWFPTADELATLPLRKVPEVEGALRVVAIGDFDYSACGGTHVAAAAEVGFVAVQRVERLKRGVRVEFLCGARARRDYARKHALLKELALGLTCAPEELPQTVGRLQGALQEARRELAQFRERSLDAEAAALLAAAEGRDGVRVITLVESGRPLDDLRGLVNRLTDGPGVVALTALAGEKTQLVFGRSEGLAADLKPFFDATLAELGGGRGGGNRILSGAAGPADPDRIAAVLHAAGTRIGGTR